MAKKKIANAAPTQADRVIEQTRPVAIMIPGIGLREYAHQMISATIHIGPK
jgi:hypothetical protein